MSEEVATPVAKRPPSLRTPWRWTVLPVLVSVALVSFLVAAPQAQRGNPLIGVAFVALALGVTVYILRSGRVENARLLIFLSTGLLFTAVFEISNTINRGSILLSEQQLATVGAPICPVTIGFVLPPLLLNGQMIFPTTVQAALSITVMWVGFGLLLGRGWCSWMCFFGPMDQFFSRLGPTRRGGRPLVEIPERWHRQLRWLPYGLLLFLILVALVALEPIFCAWLCPLRLAYDPPAVTRTVEWLTVIVIVTLGMGLLVIGPFLTKRRLFCTYGCPLLPLNSIVGLLSPFRVKVDREKCKDCGICARVCPNSAITPATVAKGGTAMECTRCGTCMDRCPQKAIDYRLIGSNARARGAFIALAVAFSLLLLSSYVNGLEIYWQTGTMPPMGGA
ncbi:MAG: 4Fe-4S binding protein [Chloroflexi bacterium]|nr:4Fe-4S binding protein [Chloroflexota bacterium]